MNWITLGGSLVAILMLAGAARLLRLGHGTEIDEREAAAAAEGALAGFEVTDIVVAADGSGALAIGGGGRLALVKRHGARAAVREVRWPAVCATAAGVAIETGERRFGRVTLAGVDVLELRRVMQASNLAPEGEVARAQRVTEGCHPPSSRTPRRPSAAPSGPPPLTGED